ncbi:hypothetical protein Belba_2609 [Belliella baltica DSM 15883]|uniref:Alginate export domain-containing protein n=2 Tax=Belliella TaxID=232244 RepID=I3Z7D6_BELBD|nr:hypothetical protein Belba_2609 [Belliella baltica DSM 15883]
MLLGGAIFMALSFNPTFAQFNLDGQFIQRGEFRNGFNRPILENEVPAKFIAHRARLQASYKMENINFYMSIQDIRTWGNTPQVKATDNFLSVHEAWLETNIGENWKIKLGRQELNYDNFRFLGNLDWELQARAHDFALVKYEKEDMKLHFGGGYNQSEQRLAGVFYDMNNNYKAAQMIRYENKFGALNFSLLFWNDGRQFAVRNQAGTITDEGINYRQTVGIPTLKYQKGNTSLSGFYYYQLGVDNFGRNVNAFDLSAQVTQQFDIDSETGKKFRFVAGLEVLSGTSNTGTLENNSFSPLYGTNHLFNGYMDLFYVGGAHENNVGLQDYYIKGRYDFNPKFFLQGDIHRFLTHKNVIQGISQLDKNLGTELDLSFGYIFNSAISLQGGYSHFLYSDTFQSLQNRGTLKNTQNWSYLMLIFRPTMKNRFIGILL